MKKFLLLLLLFIVPIISGSTPDPVDLIFVNGTGWISKQILTEELIYSIHAEVYGTGVMHLLIDGEEYLHPFSLESGMVLINHNFYFDQGQHSITFLFSNTGLNEIKNFSISQVEEEYIDTRRQWVETDDGKILEIGNMFGGSYINVNIARDYALFSTPEFQYITYYNLNGFLVIARKRHGSNYYEKSFLPVDPAPIFPDNKGYFLADPHYFISSQIDGNGYIHVAYGHHNDNLRYFVSQRPYEITDWTTNNIYNISKGDKITYPRFMKLSNGDLLMMYRNTNDGEESPRITLLSYNTNDKIWSKVYDVLITAYGEANAYLWRPVVINNTVHLAWTWRLYEFDDEPKLVFFNGVSNKDIMYAKSLDGGHTWVTSRNEAYDLPITRESSEIIQEVDIGQGMFNHFGSAYDTQGNPHFVFTRHDNNNIVQQWHLYWDGIQWKSSQITDYKQGFRWKRWQQGGQSATDVVRPSILVSQDNTAIVISRTEETDNKIELYLSSDYEHWKRIIIFNESVGGWEPQADMDLWDRNQEINLLIVGITDKAVAYRNRQEENVIDRIKALVYNLMKRLQLWKLYVNHIKGLKLQNSDYYSPDLSVDVRTLSPLVKENTGYIYEIDYKKLQSD